MPDGARESAIAVFIDRYNAKNVSRAVDCMTKGWPCAADLLLLQGRPLALPAHPFDRKHVCNPPGAGHALM